MFLYKCYPKVTKIQNHIFFNMWFWIAQFFQFYTTSYIKNFHTTNFSQYFQFQRTFSESESISSQFRRILLWILKDSNLKKDPLNFILQFFSVNWLIKWNTPFPKKSFPGIITALQAEKVRNFERSAQLGKCEGVGPKVRVSAVMHNCRLQLSAGEFSRRIACWCHGRWLREYPGKTSYRTHSRVAVMETQSFLGGERESAPRNRHHLAVLSTVQKAWNDASRSGA